MFASIAHSPAPRNAAGAYRQVHVSTGVDVASPHQLVAMLYDGLISALAEARNAMQGGNVEGKGRAIGRAVRIVDEGLNAPLDMSAGGSLAFELRDLYRYMSHRLTLANVRNDDDAIAECIKLAEVLRDGWNAIAPQVELQALAAA